MSTEVLRYNMERHCDEMVVDTNGEYVRYEDYQLVAMKLEHTKVVGLGMGMHALAGEIAKAVASDESNGGCDLSAGMFGPAMTSLIKVIVAQYLKGTVNLVGGDKN